MLELVPITESVLKLKAVCSVDPDVQFVGATFKNYFAKKVTFFLVLKVEIYPKFCIVWSGPY